MIQAGNLTVSVPHFGHKCNKKCPYCISRITGDVEERVGLFYRNLEKAQYIAHQAGVQNVLFTGKREPLKEEVIDDTLEFLTYFDYIPTELQTNGITLDRKLIGRLSSSGLNVLAISVDGAEDIRKQFDNLKFVQEMGMVSRITVNLSELTVRQSNYRYGPTIVDEIFNLCKDSGVSQLTLRKLSYPENDSNTAEAGWIREYSQNHDVVQQMSAYVPQLCENNGFWIRTLNHGDKVFDVEGISMSYNDHCIQEYSDENNVRSLIYLPNGHLYTNWNSEASILF